MSIEPLLQTMIADGRITNPDSPKGRILVAGAKLFCRKGYNRTTVRDLAAEVGILSGSIFHHFKNKDEILFGVMAEVVNALTEALKGALAQAHTPMDKVRALIHTELSFIHGPTGDAATVLVYEWASLPGEYQQQILQSREVYDQLWEQTLSDAREQHLLDMEPDVMRQLLHGAIAWSVHWFREGAGLSLDDLVERVTHLAIKPSS